MILQEMFDPPIAGYQDVDQDNSKPMWKMSRKTKLTLKQIRTLRKMIDVRNYEKKEHLKKVREQYGEKVGKAVENLVRNFKIIQNRLEKEKPEEFNKFKEEWQKYKEKKISKLSGKSVNEFYGAIDLREFITMSFTDSKFQNLLNSFENINVFFLCCCCCCIKTFKSTRRKNFLLKV